MKKIVFFLCLVVSFTKMMAQQRELVDKVVAKVGDEYVLLSEIEEQFSYAKEQRKDLPRAGRGCSFRWRRAISQRRGTRA